MVRNLFSVPIFFIVFRETLEAAIIVSVLLGLVEQIVHDDPNNLGTQTHLLERQASDVKDGPPISEAPVEQTSTEESEDNTLVKKRLIRRLRLQIFLGGAVGFFIAISIGAAFIAVWFTKATNLWAKSETLWEGIFEFIASLMILVMGLTMLKMDRAKTKWRIKLYRAFNGQHVDSKTRGGRWVLFILPLITVLREGMEAVVFVGGVSLGEKAESIPIAAVVGLCCGLICGFLIYEFASRTTLTVFLIVMTNFILLIGAGLFSSAVNAFYENYYNVLLGQDIDDAGGNGPGSFDVHYNVWHLDCCNPEATNSDQGWTIFGAVLGWTNNATVGSILAYVFYWVFVFIALVYMKYKEGRTKVLGYESAAGTRRRLAREAADQVEQNEKSEGSNEELPTLA